MPSVDKRRLRRQFTRALPGYAAAATVQAGMARRLAELVARHAVTDPTTMLELGCGDGLLTRELLARFRPRRLWVNDLLPEATDRATRLSPLVRPWPGDAETLPCPEAPLDVIVSNATFQWFVHPEDVLRRCTTWLRPGGLLAFSTFGPQHFLELRAITGAGLAYRDWAHWRAQANTSLSLLASDEARIRHYSTDWAALCTHLRATGVNAQAPRLVTRGAWQRAGRDYAQRFGTADGLPLTYQPYYLIWRRTMAESGAARADGNPGC